MAEQTERQLGLVDAEGNATPWFVQYARLVGEYLSDQIRTLGR